MTVSSAMCSGLKVSISSSCERGRSAMLSTSFWLKMSAAKNPPAFSVISVGAPSSESTTGVSPSVRDTT